MGVAAWSRHDMEMLSALLALCEGIHRSSLPFGERNPPMTRGFPPQMTRNVELPAQAVEQTVQISKILDAMTSQLWCKHWQYILLSTNTAWSMSVGGHIY